MLLAAFANSPVVHGRRTGWKSTRMASWLALDPERTSPPAVLGADPGREYARRALDTHLLSCAATATGGVSWEAPDVTFAAVDRRARSTPAPTRADLDYHLTTLFPPVRPQGHLEVRYLDQQAGDEWVGPAGRVAALMHDPDTVARARAAAEPAVDRWTAAARHGLDDRVLRRAAGERLRPGPPDARRARVRRPRRRRPRPGRPRVSERVLRGRCPADEPLDPAEARVPAATRPEAPTPLPTTPTRRRATDPPRR